MPYYAIGLSYYRFDYGYFTSVHILIVDPKTHVILPVKAPQGKRETVLSLCQDYGALAAVNGGFWKSDGRPAGILKINHEWYGVPTKPRGAIGWSRDAQTVLIDRLLTYSNESINAFPVSDFSEGSAQEWRGMAHIVGGAPVLISRGYAIEDYAPEQVLPSFLMNRRSRTAVGIRENGEWVFAVADAYCYELFGGMTMKELTELMLSIGCVKALNLDGGGSSTMVLGGSVINNPCGNLWEGDKRVRAVSDAILIFSIFGP